MPGITVKIERKNSIAEKLLKRVPENAARITKDAAEDTADYIKKHWSSVSPSSPGEPPAVVSGMLDASVDVKPAKRGGGKVAYDLKVQAWYASYLEFGTKHIAARPFIRPALYWLRQNYRSRFKNVFKVG